MITPRQAFLTLEYDGTDISSDIRKDVENFTYTDSGSDSSDSLSIKVNAMDHKWINSWMPDKEAVLHPTLCTTNWIVQGDRTVLDCGTLVVDDLSFSACPDVLTIGAVARPKENVLKHLPPQTIHLQLGRHTRYNSSSQYNLQFH